MAYTQADYERERAICDKANAYWQANATFTRGGWSSLSADLAAHPDYAACDNAMRGRVEQFELMRDLPESFTAYLETGKPDGQGARLAVQVWTGDNLGYAVVHTVGARRSQMGERQRYGRAVIGGKVYRWQGPGAGMYARFRAVKGKAAA